MSGMSSGKSPSVRPWPRVQLGLILGDALLWVLGLFVATWGRLDFQWELVARGRLIGAAGIAIGIGTGCGLLSRLYFGARRPGSFEEALTLAACSATATVGLTAIVAAGPNPHLVPLSAALAGGAYQLIGAFALRYVRRLASTPRAGRNRRTRHRPHRVLVFGAGEAGGAIVKALLADPDGDLLPVALIDDDPSKAYLRLHGLRVAGGRQDIGAAAAEYEADTLLMAIPSATHDEQVAVANLAQQAGLALKILPNASEWVVDRPGSVTDIREFTVADYLGRSEVRMNMEQVAGFVTGQRVLATGAGGFIGSALAETLARFGPRRLTLIDHDENALHALGLRLAQLGTGVSYELVLADIRDRDAMWRHFADRTPDVVFHAAAHKHVDVLERFPAEAFKTNVAGTLHLLQAAAAAGTERFVNVSTDKAAHPIGVLGASKRIGEMLTAHYAAELDRAYMSVRFGNVLGSTGSVLHTFRHQANNRLPLTVTHPEVSRYFMTDDEAVRLVIQAAAIGGAGDALVLDMGDPVRIVDLARQVAAELRPGWDPEIVFIGLRPGDKLTEVLVSAHDVHLDQPHERVGRYRVPPLDPAAVESLERRLPDDMLGRRMLHLAGGAAWEPQDVST